jgi:hypothetical protein
MFDQIERASEIGGEKDKPRIVASIRGKEHAKESEVSGKGEIQDRRFGGGRTAGIAARSFFAPSGT